MATATAPKTAPKSKLDEEWFARLRAALKKGVLSVNPTGALEEHYKKVEKHLAQIEGYGFKTDDLRAEYDKIVAQILKAADDKSESDIKKADKALKQFDDKLKKDKDNIKTVVKDCKWEASRAAALQVKQEFEQQWGTPEETAPFDKKYREVLQFGFSANKKTDTKPKQEAIATQTDNNFKALVTEVEKAIERVKGLKESWEQEQEAADKYLEVYAGIGSEPDPALFRKGLDVARQHALSDHKFVDAKKQCETVKQKLLDALKIGLVPKREFEKLDGEVGAKLADAKSQVSEAIYNGLNFQYQAAVASASGSPPNFTKAKELLTKLAGEIDQRIKGVEQAKQAWAGNENRKWIRQRYEELQKEYVAKDEATKGDSGAFKCVPTMNGVGLGGLVMRLTAIEETATATGDYERAINDVMVLRGTFDERVALLARTVENAQKSGADQQLHTKEADKVAKLLEALTRLMNEGTSGAAPLIPKQLQDRVAKYSLVPPVADPGKFAEKLKEYAAELQKLTVEVQALLDDSGKRDAYKKGEAADVEIKKHREAYDKLKPVVNRLLLQLADLCEPAKDPYAKRKTSLDAAEKDVKSTEPATVKKAADTMQSLATDLPGDIKDREKGIVESRKKLETAVEEFNKEFLRLDGLHAVLAKLPGGDACKGYRKNLKDQVKKIEDIKDTQNPEVLESGLKKVAECKAKLLATEDKKSGPKSPVREEMVKRTDRLKLLKKRLEVKEVGKCCKTRQTELKDRYTRVQAILSGNTDPSKPDELAKLDAAIDDLDGQVDVLVKEATLISQKKKSVKKKCTELDKQLKELASAMKALKKDPEFAKADIKGEDFGELGKERKRIDTLATGEDLAKYTQAEEIAVKLATKLADAIKSPADSVRGEQTALANKKKAEEELTRKKEKYEWEYNSFVNGDYKQAKEGQDKKALEHLESSKQEAEELAKKKDYEAALKRLALMRNLAEVLINSPPGGLTSKTLKPLQQQWQTTVKRFSDDIKALQAAIVAECQGKELAKPTPAEIDKLGKDVLKLATLFDPQAFDPFVALLLDKNVTDTLARRTARERGLDIVRQYQRTFTGDPLIDLVIKNPFHAVLSGNVLWETLNRLDLGFQICV